MPLNSCVSQSGVQDILPLFAQSREIATKATEHLGSVGRAEGARDLLFDPDQWIKTYWEGTQPRYETTVETTFQDLVWTEIDTEPGIVISVVEVEGCVTHNWLEQSRTKEKTLLSQRGFGSARQ